MALKDYFFNSWKADKLAVDREKAEQSPYSQTMGLPSPEQIAALKSMFPEEQAQEMARTKLRSLFGGQGPLTEGQEAAVPAMSQLESPYVSPQEEVQKKYGFNPDVTPTNIALERMKVKDGEVTPALLAQLASRERNADKMAQAQSGRQENTFDQQRRMAEEAERRKKEAEDRAEERKPPTESMSITATYANRMDQSDPILEEFTPYVKTMNPVWFTAQAGSPDFLNALRDPQFQSYDQARSNFLNAALRRESGAVISMDEFVKGNKQYFPLPGDSDQVLAQKKQNREVAIKTFRTGAGKAYKPLYASPIEVGAALQGKKITEKQAQFILKRDFGFQD